MYVENSRLRVGVGVDLDLDLFILIVGAIFTAKLIELAACWLFNLGF